VSVGVFGKIRLAKCEEWVLTALYGAFPSLLNNMPVLMKEKPPSGFLFIFEETRRGTPFLLNC